MSKILLVEDNIGVNKVLSLELIKNGYEVTSVFSGEEALNEYKDDKYDLIILDLTLPKMSGFVFMQIIRKTSNIPIIISTSNNSTDYRVNSIMLGANDFLVKPTTKESVLNSVKTVLESMKKKKVSSNNRIKFKDIEVYLDQHTLKKNGIPIKLTSKEYEILRLMLTNPGTAFEKSVIYQIVWDEEYSPVMDNTINVHIKSLRRKLSKSTDKFKIIETIWGYGYRLSTDILDELQIS